MLLKTRTKKLALCAMLTAVSVVFLYLASILPTAKLAVTAVAGLLPAAAVITCGMGWATGLWIATSILALLICPQKDAAMAYLLVLGHYPMLKSLIERLDKLWGEWLLKIGLFYVLLLGFYFVFRTLFLQLITPPMGLLVVFFLGCGAAFVVYDIAFSRLIALFIRRVGKYIK